MAKLLVVAAFAWPALLAAGWWAQVADGPRWLVAVAYLPASRVCHQRPDRSFQTDGVQWPVCGRCAGLYLAAPFGALAALAARRRGVPAIRWYVAAATPTAIAFFVEHAGLAPVSTTLRALAALPLGAASAYYIVAVTRPDRTVRVN
jgi:uncharacterized membrane protein